ncbi:hypothetical protein HHK36_010781 [Tetracentron sinense]|uniref:Phosphatidylinositol N-acetylglucosaminyltransferase n=1 Tax=Tetracentron sinense TaxID=13715 RepID=A0A835DFL8_TETSI|nr:hypothetical protein HHK36_010781 [Tetracentron sinense]
MTLLLSSSEAKLSKEGFHSSLQLSNYREDRFQVSSSLATIVVPRSAISFSIEEDILGVEMETKFEGNPSATPRKWRKVAYGGMQPGYDDNYSDESFLEDMVMNANVVKRDMLKVMQDSVSISQYLCVVVLVVCVWTYTLGSTIDENSLLLLDAGLLGSGFLVLLLTAERLSLDLLSHYLLNISFFISGLYVLAPIYHTLTRSISSDSIWALTVSLLVVHLFLHDYSGSTIKPPGALNNPTLTSNISLNASIVASVLIASRLPSRLQVFAIMLFSLQVFLFAPLVTYCIKKYSFGLHLCFSFGLMAMTLWLVFTLHGLLFSLLLSLLVFVTVVCPYWLIRMQEYKFEINGPWDEAKLCFDIKDARIVLLHSPSDVFVMPSKSKALGLVVFEAMSSGIPVVTALAGGIQEGKTGFLFSPGDIEDCLSKLEAVQTAQTSTSESEIYPFCP